MKIVKVTDTPVRCVHDPYQGRVQNACVLYNSSGSITIYLDDMESVDTSGVPLNPGGKVVYNGTTAVYAVCAQGQEAVLYDLGAGVNEYGPGSSVVQITNPPPAQSTSQSNSLVTGIGATGTFWAAADNPNGLQLWSASLSSIAVASGNEVGANFAVEDQITDSGGTLYLSCEIGMCTGQEGAVPNSNGMDYGTEGLAVPAGVALQLVNGGAGSSFAGLRKASGTVCFTVL